MLTQSEIKISFNEKTTDLPTIYVDGLNFNNSNWQFSHVNLNMIDCHAAFLMLAQ